MIVRLKRLRNQRKFFLIPSWADEFISGIINTYPNKLEFINTKNSSVEASLTTVLEETDCNF